MWWGVPPFLIYRVVGRHAEWGPLETWPRSFALCTHQQLAIWWLKERISSGQMVSALIHRQELRWNMADIDDGQCKTQIAAASARASRG
jgi:hypothetical protein